jgi:pimeloyl-ACP methyl ester carboxylesterase
MVVASCVGCISRNKIPALANRVSDSIVRISQESEFTFNEFRYKGQLWGEAGGVPALAIHGWLDNSASFDVLAPLLQGVQLLAPDLAGHGHSDHRPGLSDYPVWSEIIDFFAMADAMAWQQFALIGHSRGAMMALLAAAVFPDRISHLILIDALAPPPVRAEQAPERFIKSIQEIHRRLRRECSCYPSYEAALQARCNSEFGKVNRASAALLASRGLTELEQGFHWHADGKLWAPSNIALSAEQITAFIEKITAKTLVLLGKDGLKPLIQQGSAYEALLQQIIVTLNADVQEFDDGHFLHMEKAATQVATTITHFIVDTTDA